MENKGPSWPELKASQKRPRTEDNTPAARVSVQTFDFQPVAVETIKTSRPGLKSNGSHDRSESMPLTDRTNMSIQAQKPCPDHDKITKEVGVLKGKIDDIITTWQDRIADMESEVNGLSIKDRNAITNVLLEEMGQESQLCAVIRSTVEAAVQSKLADIITQIQNTAVEVDKLRKNTAALADSKKISPTGPTPNTAPPAVPVQDWARIDRMIKESNTRSYQHIAKLNANLSLRVQALEASARINTQPTQSNPSAAKPTSESQPQPLGTGVDALTRRIEAQEALISQMKKQMRVMEAQINKKEEAVANYAATTHPLKELEAQVKGAVARAKAEIERLTALGQQTQAQVEQLSAAMERVRYFEGRVQEQGSAGAFLQRRVEVLESHLPLRAAPPVQNADEEMMEAARTLMSLRHGRWE
ncbi:hypothetical protein B0T19DRAFT_404080 [Cercophora scortea]|uniref:Uncharacterized protein n=1 Tax=Cercophora scortea TaxID=314031 RepID=A0AAE0I878_9PEZI|nr:hypothetical protein B0T19DRAFT_404080 [Cercophora scortea]